MFKVADNRMFAAMSAEGEDVLRVTVKLTAEEREIAMLLPFVSVARYVGRYGWVTAAVTDEETLEAALEWVRESYWLKAPHDQKRAVERMWADELESKEARPDQALRVPGLRGDR